MLQPRTQQAKSGIFFDTYITESGEKTPRAVALRAKIFPYQWTSISQVIFGSCSEKILQFELLSMLRPLTLHHMLRESFLALLSLKWKVPLLGINVQKRQGGWKKNYIQRRKRGEILIFTKSRPPELKVGRNTLDSSFYEGFEVLVL